MRTSSPGERTRGDEDTLHQYGSNSSSPYDFLTLLCFLVYCISVFFIWTFSPLSDVLGELDFCKAYKQAQVLVNKDNEEFGEHYFMRFCYFKFDYDLIPTLFGKT